MTAERLGHVIKSLRRGILAARVLFLRAGMLIALGAMHFLSADCFADGSEGGGSVYASAVEQRADLAADIEVLRSEQSVLLTEDRSAGVLLQDLSRMVNPDLRERLIGLLDANFAPVPRAVNTAVGTAVTSDDLQRDLARTHDRLITNRKLLLEVSAQRQFAGQLAALFNVGNKWLWLGGVVAFGTLLALVMHDRRRGLRRLLWVQRTRAVALVLIGVAVFAVPLLPTVLTFALGDQTYETLLALTSRRTAEELGEDPAAQLKAVQAEVMKLDETRKQLLTERQRLVAKRRQRLEEVFGTQVTLASDWATLRDDVLKSNSALLARQEMAAKLKEDLDRVEKLDSLLAKEEQGIESNTRTQRLAGAALGMVLLGVVMTGGMAFQRSVKAREKTIANTCPRCLAVGTLVTEPSPVGTPTSLSTDLNESRCTSVLSESPYEECGFSFRSQYRSRIKISFPTLGISNSGKTHWMAMISQQLNQGKAPDGVHFERIQSSGSARFDSLVRDILQARVGMSATRQGLPEPLIFGFRDRDRLSFTGTDIVVNMFDYAGTVSMVVGLHDSIRVRQLNSEGFLFFLDPTKPSDTQVEALLKFREEVKLVKRLGAGRQLHTPVALCVSKIDMTVCQPFAQGGDVMQSFFQELDEIDRRTTPMSLTRIRKRSDLAAGLRDVIWPNWEIENQIRGLFGDRFMFFPMTPVSLPPAGVTDERIINDLSQRTIDPYGILEPLLWLLHMNGYPVLKP